MRGKELFIAEPVPYQPAKGSSATMRRCPKACEFKDCQHHGIHKHHYSCVRDRRDPCPSCIIETAAPKKKPRGYDSTNKKKGGPR